MRPKTILPTIAIAASLLPLALSRSPLLSRRLHSHSHPHSHPHRLDAALPRAAPGTARDRVVAFVHASASAFASSPIGASSTHRRGRRDQTNADAAAELRLRASAASTPRCPSDRRRGPCSNTASSFFGFGVPSSGRCPPLLLMGESSGDGMEEAFASLDGLSPEDLDEARPADDDVLNVRRSRTDDTPASDAGKSTPEEVELYLEMQGELEGTTVSNNAEEANDAPTECDETNAIDDEEDIMVDGSLSDDDAPIPEEDEYPWTSVNPILRLRGPVASGYGRGGKKLGVPTANLPASLFQSALEGVTNGVYFGWAVVEQSDGSSTKKGRNAPVKAVVNVGYSPTFEGKENKEKIAEAHLITTSSPMTKPDRGDGGAEIGDGETDGAEVEGDFYDETMRLQLIGYLRPEQKFDAFPDLIAQIHRDIGNAHWALDEMPYVFSKEDEFVKDGAGWIGSGGGDGVASWEFESW